MEWIVLLAVVWLGAKYWRKFAAPARRASAQPHTAQRKLPPITPEMIEPRDKPLTRQDAAKAYISFYIDHFNPSNGYELELAEEHLLTHISEHIEMLETEREETRRRLKIARRILRDEENETDTVSDDDYWTAPPYRDEPISETVARRQARFAAQDKAIDALKADVRTLLVDFLNEEIKQRGLA